MLRIPNRLSAKLSQVLGNWQYQQYQPLTDLQVLPFLEPLQSNRIYQAQLVRMQPRLFVLKGLEYVQWYR